MFSLIITIISIALVAALALATIYYGGQALSSRQAVARAAQVELQGQQIMAAMEVYHLQTGQWPAQLSDLTVNGEYLKSLPVSQADEALLPTALAQSTTNNWTMPAGGVPVIQLALGAEAEACRAVNNSARGDNGILETIYTNLRTQCYGADLDALSVVIAKSPQDLIAAFDVSEYSTAAIPAASAQAGWAAAPTGNGSAPPPAPPPAQSGTFQFVSSARYNGYVEVSQGVFAGQCTINGLPPERSLGYGMTISNTGTTPLTVSVSAPGAEYFDYVIYNTSLSGNASTSHTIPAGESAGYLVVTHCTSSPGAGPEARPTSVTFTTSNGTHVISGSQLISGEGGG